MKRKVIALFVTTMLLMTLFSGCGKKDSGEKLYLYNWTEYIPQNVYDAFEEETDRKSTRLNSSH